MHIRALVVAAACLGLPLLAVAQEPQLRLPELRHLQEQAVESVNVTLGPFELGFAAAFMDGHDPGVAQIKKTFMQGIKTVTVRSFKFDTDVLPGSEIGELRQQLQAPGWSQLVQVHDGDKSEDVGVYLAYDGSSVHQLAVLHVSPREITLVHVTGNLDPNRLAELRRTFEHSDPAAQSTF